MNRLDQTEGPVTVLIKPRDHDIGGFSVRRVLPAAGRRQVGPWVFFDHVGPVHFPAGQGIDVRPHPHLNLATVTYLFDGEILHRDSLGSLQPIVPGDINLMVAGSGVVHSERERPEIRESDHDLHGLQLWLGLPEEDEQTAPAFYHYAAEDIPTVTVNQVPVRVMMGSAYAVASPVKTFAETFYAEARLQKGQQLVLPTMEECAVYVVQGEITVGSARIAQHSMAAFFGEHGITVNATSGSRIVVIGGQALGRRYLEWNFVSSSRERIEKAKLDWKAGHFPRIPGDEDEFIPLPGDDNA